MSDGRFFYGNINGISIVKPVGSINYRVCAFFDRFINELFEDKIPCTFLIDLTETTYLDSTSLGLIAKIHTYCIKNFDKRPTIVSSNPTVDEILTSLGFDKLFDIVSSSPNMAPTTELTEIPYDDNAGQSEIGRIMLAAHRQLMEINEENVKKFQSVVRLLEKDVASNTKDNV